MSRLLAVQELVRRARLVRYARGSEEKATSSWSAASWGIWLKDRPGFCVIVLVPFLSTLLYSLLLEAPRYESEARIVVRTVAASSDPIALPSSTITPSASGGQNINIVVEYMRSRDALRSIVETIDYRSMVALPDSDLLWRFPAFFGSNSFESLFRYYQQFLVADIQTDSGIGILKFQTFRPADAQLALATLVASAEALVNRLNERAMSDAVRSASDDVDLARKRVAEAQGKVTDWRMRAQIVDPEAFAEKLLETLTALAIEIARTRIQLSELERSSPDSPQAESLRSRLAALEKQSAQERAAIAGSDSSLAAVLSEFEALSLERGFAEEALMSALTSLELARQEGRRQQLYVARIAEPSLPDYPSNRWSFLNAFIVGAAALALYGLLSLLWKNLQAHGSQFT